MAPRRAKRLSQQATLRAKKRPGRAKPIDAPTTEGASAPAERRGPRPLALHLKLADLLWSSLRAALPALVAQNMARQSGVLLSPGPQSPGAPPPPDPPRDLANELAELSAKHLGPKHPGPKHPGQSRGAASPDVKNLADDLPTLIDAVDRVGERRLLTFAEGVRAYRAHAHRRALPEPPVLWRQGTTRLLDYGVPGARRPLTVLVIPSLVNRGTILDLTAETSLMRFLARQGMRPLLVDWDAPGARERAFDLSDYIADRLTGALDAAVAAAGGPVALVGYCMGGNLALALALRRPDAVRGLACLATPWDFLAGGPLSQPLEPTSIASLAAAVAALPEFPVDLLQAMFASLDPALVGRKFRAFAGSQADDTAGLFVAIEDWVNDGVPLASKVARDCLIGWYGENRPARGEWLVAGEAVRPERLQCPALLIMPQRDRIVPPASSSALAAALPRARSLSVPCGHVAMIVGPQAPRQTWQPLTHWLRGLMSSRPTTSARSRRAAKRPSGRATGSSSSRRT